MVETLIVIMAVVSAVIIFYIGFLVGKASMLRGVRVHRISVMKPYYVPDDLVRLSMMGEVKTHILNNKLIKTKEEDGMKIEELIFYTRNER